ncbi:hypothetical protein Desde_1637 [Desulfitobacterium dehalogenans ATCC 51507]|uniref:AAA+ ATPase domain-containing protein n=1 Tax=Desulfitobacterium dehalogenans (strain ATCC 51507 / DSM 9161 / JW/IU-DC1) TaxID=756499 RepID=I4A7V5_DESDJ|nr:DUF2075 domain-containing protein [Desulfitobacterium dehalogenans]AFM00040.1 hypothetical protein Desde_1637 [Desulfitobacterium dehalogenans ATCC 51507]
MLVYAELKKDFMQHVRDNRISDMILDSMKRKFGRGVGRSEQQSWQVSLQFMRNILDDTAIPDNSGIAIEYNIPQTGRRIDFIISGYDENRSGNVIIIELKQWDEAKLSRLNDHVQVAPYGDVRHPSYQAWSYKTLMEDYNTTIQQEQIGLYPCAYLHNYKEDENVPVIRNSFYEEYLREAPAFLKNDSEKLRSFIKRFIKHGDKKEVLYKIDAGKIRPSKNLANCLASLMAGKREFVLIEEQKTVYETALALADTVTGKKKRVLIVRGGPGTGKSVVAINLIVELTKREKLVHYVTSNAAPRAIYEARLSGEMRKTRISNMFKGATVYQGLEENAMDVLIVDEAHRLSARNLLNTYKGNQVKDLINAAKLTVFFLDEAQKVLIEDIGSEEEIVKQAKAFGAEVTVKDLPSQFRCNGSDGYLAWLDTTLGIRETANMTLEGIDYDFRIIDSPAELHRLIREKNVSVNFGSGSRMVAGYCWPWASKKNPIATDINIGDYQVRWNKSSDGSLWAIAEDSIEEIGCIHTCQGLEFDYVGVIIGEDLIVKDGVIVTQPEARDKVDANKTLRGYKTMIKDKDPSVVEKAKLMADEVIRNTYKVLMTRGQKGCYVYCCNRELAEYLKSRISGPRYSCNEKSYSMAAEEPNKKYKGRE